jgi:hypothetical protein
MQQQFAIVLALFKRYRQEALFAGLGLLVSGSAQVLLLAPGVSALIQQRDFSVLSFVSGILLVVASLGLILWALLRIARPLTMRQVLIRLAILAAASLAVIVLFALALGLVAYISAPENPAGTEAAKLFVDVVALLGGLAFICFFVTALASVLTFERIHPQGFLTRAGRIAIGAAPVYVVQYSLSLFVSKPLARLGLSGLDALAAVVLFVFALSFVQGADTSPPDTDGEGQR